jgi:hypothetical protein
MQREKPGKNWGKGSGRACGDEGREATVGQLLKFLAEQSAAVASGAGLASRAGKESNVQEFSREVSAGHEVRKFGLPA